MTESENQQATFGLGQAVIKEDAEEEEEHKDKQSNNSNDEMLNPRKNRPRELIINDKDAPPQLKT